MSIRNGYFFFEKIWRGGMEARRRRSREAGKQGSREDVVCSNF
jgi:hypothetical protein